MKLTIPSLEVNDDRAVSPVIGVILMVAITVILAAVIGAFVLNLGSDIQNTAPQASIQAIDAGDNFNGSGNINDGDPMFYVNHQQGDDIQFQNLKIVITAESGEQIGTLNGTSWEDSNTGINATIDDELPQGSTAFSTGDQLTIKVQNDSTVGEHFEAGTQYTFQFIDQNSGSTVTTSTTTLQ